MILAAIETVVENAVQCSNAEASSEVIEVAKVEAEDPVAKEEEKPAAVNVPEELTAVPKSEPAENANNSSIVESSLAGEKQSSEKLSQMADLLLSFSGEKKEEPLAVKDEDLAKVGADLQNLNSCIDEISEPTKTEAKPEEREKLENLEAMRKEMEEMVTVFDTYL